MAYMKDAVFFVMGVLVLAAAVGSLGSVVLPMAAIGGVHLWKVGLATVPIGISLYLAHC